MNTELSEVTNDFKNIKSKDYHKIWEPFMRKYNCNYVCELGIYKGDNFINMIAHGPKLAVAIDTWKDNGVHPRKTDDYTQAEFDEQYEFFRNRVKDNPFVRIIRDYTINAAREFPDNYFDFVYVDADHTAEGCYQDLIAWYPKVKPGKFLVGHDYRRGFGVIDAVDKFIKEHNLSLIFLPPSNWATVKK